MGSTYKKIDKQGFLKLCQDYALSKGGKCLSLEYNTVHEKLLWECHLGHVWEAIPSNVKRGKWCSVCSGNKKLTLDVCIKYATDKGGKCLSTVYVNAATPLMWECCYGHVWNANFNNVKSKNSWCPECSANNIGEAACRAFFEQFFGKLFPKIRPSWLRTDEHYRGLELDGFNEELGLAFEYQGPQHYEVDGFFIRSEDRLNQRVADDKLKVELCNVNNVKVIAVPFIKSINIEKLTKSLLHIMEDGGFVGNTAINIDIIGISPFYNKIDRYKELAKIRGGKCLSEFYTSSHTKLIFECGEGHVWSTVGHNVEKGHWCPTCAHKNYKRKKTNLNGENYCLDKGFGVR